MDLVQRHARLFIGRIRLRRPFQFPLVLFKGNGAVGKKGRGKLRALKRPRRFPFPRVQFFGRPQADTFHLSLFSVLRGGGFFTSRLLPYVFRLRFEPVNGYVSLFDAKSVFLPDTIQKTRVNPLETAQCRAQFFERLLFPVRFVR